MKEKEKIKIQNKTAYYIGTNTKDEDWYLLDMGEKRFQSGATPNAIMTIDENGKIKEKKDLFEIIRHGKKSQTELFSKEFPQHPFYKAELTKFLTMLRAVNVLKEYATLKEYGYANILNENIIALLKDGEESEKALGVTIPKILSHMYKILDPEKILEIGKTYYIAKDYLSPDEGVVEATLTKFLSANQYEFRRKQGATVLIAGIYNIFEYREEALEHHKALIRQRLKTVRENVRDIEDLLNYATDHKEFINTTDRRFFVFKRAKELALIDEMPEDYKEIGGYL